MDHIQIKKGLIKQLIEISKEAGKAILEVYNTDFDYQIKEDLSPLTKADTISHNIICERLKALTPNIPILSEENSDVPFNKRSLWKQYWLVDPLDGTKEFIKRNGEFTVNIALIRKNRPVLGIIFVPVTNEAFYGHKDGGSFYITENSSAEKIQVTNSNKRSIRVVSSRSHPSKELNSFLEKINNNRTISVGSSLKFCLIASGKADIYPRFGPTSEWDTAAGDAILSFAGGSIVDFSGEPIQYNKNKSSLNPNFIASNDKIIPKNILKLINEHN